MKLINRINIKEFRKLGFLQELNRQFLHPVKKNLVEYGIIEMIQKE